MKSFGALRPWPPDLEAELRQLFSNLKSRHLQGDRPDPHPDLKTMLGELDVWLDDPRNDQRTRKNEWQSLIDDFETAAATREIT